MYERLKELEKENFELKKIIIDLLTIGLEHEKQLQAVSERVKNLLL